MGTCADTISPVIKKPLIHLFQCIYNTVQYAKVWMACRKLPLRRQGEGDNPPLPVVLAYTKHKETRCLSDWLSLHSHLLYTHF